MAAGRKDGSSYKKVHPYSPSYLQKEKLLLVGQNLYQPGAAASLLIIPFATGL